MSDGIVGSLKDAWGVEDDGPNPETLSGLLEMSEEWLEDEEKELSELVHHFELMRNRLVGHHMEKSQALRSGEVEYDAQFAILVEKSLGDMVVVEKSLEKFIEGASAGERDECWEALGELEQAAETLRESGAAIENFLQNSPPVCMSCSSIGPEPVCTKCGGERLILDPSPAMEDERRLQVTEEVALVYESYRTLLTGQGTMNSLVTNLQSLEFTYLEVEAICEQTMANEVATDRIRNTGQSLITSIQGTLQGIQMMHGVQKNRSSRQLTAGWMKILDNSVRAQELLLKLQAEVGTLR